MKKSIWIVTIALCISTSIFISCKKDDPDPTDENPSPSTPTFTDSRDGKTYKMITIGTQTWMAENLNYQGALSAGKDTCYDNNASNCTSYGALYTWEAANAIAPTGWHLPSDEEWKTLEKYLGMTTSDAELDGSWRGTDTGTKVKSGGSSGLNLKHSGFYQFDISSPSFTGLETTGRYWTSTLKSGTEYYERAISTSSTNAAKILRTGRDKNFMLSVRCIKN